MTRIAMFILFAILAGASAQASTPLVINYQGFLTDSAGAPIDTAVPVTFSLYTTPDGSVPVWSSTHTVVAQQGLFSVELGALVGFPANLFDTTLWLGISVDGDDEMMPRRQLGKVPYAFEADDALTLQGQSPTAFDQSAHVADTGNPHNVTAAQAGAASSSDLSALMTQVNNLVTQVGNLETALNNANTTIANLQSDISTLQTSLATETTNRITGDNGLSAAIATINSNSVLALDGKLTLNGSTARFNAVNVEITNGSGATEAVNGLGNLVIGYNTDGGFCSDPGFHGNEGGCTGAGESWTPSTKSGSHNVVIGNGHDYSQFGGLVSGLNNRVSGPWTSVTGGFGNTASGVYASVGGGFLNTASGFASKVAGGRNNVASADQSTVSGGSFSSATGTNATVSGGDQNTAAGIGATVSGGSNNLADAFAATIGGGSSHTLVSPSAFQASPTTAVTALQADSVPGLGAVFSLSGNTAQFSGVNVQIVNGTGSTDGTPDGTGNLIVGYDAAGGFCSEPGAPSQGVCENIFLGTWAPSAKTGSHNIVVGDSHHYSQFGGLVSGTNNRISGAWSNVTGGSFNTAGAGQSSVSGGFANTASGPTSSVSGGSENTAVGEVSNVSGGSLNIANGIQSSVSGGNRNNAIGAQSSVSGGDDVTCAADVCGEGVLDPSD